MIKVSILKTPEEDKLILSFECNSASGAQDELDELYRVLMTHKFLGMGWKDSDRFEALVQEVQKE